MKERSHQMEWHVLRRISTRSPCLSSLSQQRHRKGVGMKRMAARKMRTVTTTCTMTITRTSRATLMMTSS